MQCSAGVCCLKAVACMSRRASGAVRLKPPYLRSCSTEVEAERRRGTSFPSILMGATRNKIACSVK
eukprot:15463156-Alexandrium_andersonii.AAC.1